MNQAQLLEFLAPGFVHGICNSLFKIQGQAELLGQGLSEAPQEVSASLVRSCREAAEAVEIYRLVLDPKALSVPVVAGSLVAALAGILRPGLHDSGVSLHWDAAVSELPQAVDRAPLVLPVVTAAYHLRQAMPSGYQASMALSAQADRAFEITIQVVPDPGCLPFDLDLAPAIQHATASLGKYEGEVSASATGVGIHIALPVGAVR
jgi:hypothetical protein